MKPEFKNLRYWVEYYARDDAPDQQAAINFVEVESYEKVKSLKDELFAIRNSNFDPRILEQLLGVKRISRHQSYQNWAKLMMVWITSYKG